MTRTTPSSPAESARKSGEEQGLTEEETEDEVSEGEVGGGEEVVEAEEGVVMVQGAGTKQ